MKCPFRKKAYIESGRNTGCGYPDAWVRHEDFDDCIESFCMMFNKEKECCMFCINNYVLSKDFEQKLP